MKKITTNHDPIDIKSDYWTLTKKENEDFVKQCSEIRWIEWDDRGRMIAEYKNIDLGRSLFLDPSGLSYNWMTSPVEKIIKQEEKLLEFKTENSHYILTHYDARAI